LSAGGKGEEMKAESGKKRLEITWIAPWPFAILGVIFGVAGQLPQGLLSLFAGDWFLAEFAVAGLVLGGFFGGLGFLLIAVVFNLASDFAGGPIVEVRETLGDVKRTIARRRGRKRIDRSPESPKNEGTETQHSDEERAEDEEDNSPDS
jgi:hypothetical protein